MTTLVNASASGSAVVDGLLAELTLLVERDGHGEEQANEHEHELAVEKEEEQQPPRRATSEAPEEGEVREDTPEQPQPPVPVPVSPPAPTPADAARAALNARLKDALAARPKVEDYLSADNVRSYLQKRGG